jgi:hypothetical protein
MSIKAIPTYYSGILYRSRLEACWAAFFTQLGVVFDYELDAYELPSGNYLPDFYLHGVDRGTWVEIKPFQPIEMAYKLCGELAAATGHGAYLVWGSPISVVNDVATQRWPYFGWRMGDDYCAEEGYRFCICPRCKTLCLSLDGNGETGCDDHDSYGEDKLTYNHPILVSAAIEAQRSVRWDPGVTALPPPPVKIPKKVEKAWQRRHV